mmetsp:Transcript_15930/g.24612  ORF Transcript_15930/g.24612 Transcript_15930/m.24612 type:complete len:156 (-) Transcript_15930:2015-2482(-)
MSNSTKKSIKTAFREISHGVKQLTEIRVGLTSNADDLASVMTPIPGSGVTSAQPSVSVSSEVQRTMNRQSKEGTTPKARSPARSFVRVDAPRKTASPNKPNHLSSFMASAEFVMKQDKQIDRIDYIESPKSSSRSHHESPLDHQIQADDFKILLK